MSNPQKPQRLSGERLETVEATIEALEMIPGSQVAKAIAGVYRELLGHIAALTAELEERTSERDEAVDALSCQYSDGNTYPCRECDACKIMERPADDR